MLSRVRPGFNYPAVDVRSEQLRKMCVPFSTCIIIGRMIAEYPPTEIENIVPNTIGSYKCIGTLSSPEPGYFRYGTVIHVSNLTWKFGFGFSAVERWVEQAQVIEFPVSLNFIE